MKRAWRPTIDTERDLDSDPVHDFVPFLLHRVVTKAVAVASAEYTRLGLTIPEARVLIVLLHRPGIRAGDLAKLTSIEQSALSHLLRGLTRKKIITRERVEKDLRSVTIGLTTQGRRIAEECFDHGMFHERVLLEDIEPSEATLLRSLLRRMFENAERWEAKALQAESTGDVAPGARNKRKAPASVVKTKRATSARPGPD